MRVSRFRIATTLIVAAWLASLAPAPASADVVVSPEYVSGVFTLGTADHPFPDEEADPPCPPDFTGVDFTFDAIAGSPPSFAWSVAGEIKVIEEFPQASGNWWQISVLFDPVNFPNGGTMNWDNAGPPQEWVIDGVLTPMVTIYQLDETCEKDDPVCDLILQGVVDDTLSRHYGAIPPTAGDTTHIEAATDPFGIRPFALGTCNVTILGFVEGQFAGLIADIGW